jgi:hypothetical protein
VLVLSLRAKGGLENLFLEENKMRVSELIKILQQIGDPEILIYNEEHDRELSIEDIEFDENIIIYTEN